MIDSWCFCFNCGSFFLSLFLFFLKKLKQYLPFLNCNQGTRLELKIYGSKWTFVHTYANHPYNDAFFIFHVA